MKTDYIQLSDDLRIPLNSLLSRKIAAMGTNGSGKTYGIMKMLEEILRKQGWVIIFDPVGIYYGLRLDPKGKNPSDIKIPIFGGSHGDMPLVSESGKLVADLLFERKLSAILDVSEFTDSELNRFCADFAERFLSRMKSRKSAVSLVLDECQIFIPQNPQKGEEKKLHHFSRLGQVGRNYGIGLMMISPRPQEVSKRILNMSQLMFAFQMSGSHERDAMRDWFKHNGYKEALDQLLPTLEVGAPFVSSPAWLKINKVIKRIHSKTTFDSSATPEFDDSARSQVALPPLDMESIREAMQGVIEQAKADDPKALRNEIAALKKELQKAQTVKPLPVSQPEIEYIDRPIFTTEQIAALTEATERLQITSNHYTESAQLIQNEALAVEKTKKEIQEAIRQAGALAKPQPSRTFTPQGVYKTATPAKTPQVRDNGKEHTEREGGLTGPEQRIVDAIAWMESIGLSKPQRSMVAFFSGYSHKSTGFTNPLGSLRSLGSIVYPDSKTVALTDRGRMSANQQPDLLTTAELHRAIFEKLPSPPARILQVLIDRYPHAVDREQLASLSGYSFNSTGFTNPLGTLRSLGMIDYPDSKSAIALPVLFLES